MTDGHQWRVEALTKIVGLNSIDDLTKTRAKVKFKTASFTGGGPVYDGSDPRGNCWGNNFPSPPFYYYVEDCTITATSLNGPSSIYAKVEGEYSHALIPPWGHTTTAKATARGYYNMPYVFHATCSGTSLPSDPADLECELHWEYLEYQ